MIMNIYICVACCLVKRGVELLAIDTEYFQSSIGFSCDTYFCDRNKRFDCDFKVSLVHSYHMISFGQFGPFPFLISNHILALVSGKGESCTMPNNPHFHTINKY